MTNVPRIGWDAGGRPQRAGDVDGARRAQQRARIAWRRTGEEAREREKGRN